MKEVTGLEGVGNGESVFHGDRDSVWGDRDVLEADHGSQPCEYT